jgi:hypothetical protein
LLLQGRCSAISGTVVEFPGAVVGDGVQILIFLHGFCRGDRGGSIYDDDLF